MRSHGIPRDRSLATGIVLLVLCTASRVAGQTQPAPLELPYAEQFSTLAHASTGYPIGWQGWRIGTSSSSAFEVVAPSADLALIPNSTAAANTGGVHNYNGTIGLLSSSSVNCALVLSISASSRYAIQVDYALATIRNPYNGAANTRISEATLQYRIGTTGDFIPLPGPVYTTGTTTQNGAVTTPLDVAFFTRTLPSTCDYQPIVQLRWVVRDASGSGGRPSIAVDAVNVTGNWFPMFAGGVGDGHAVDAFSTPGPAASIFDGGAGRGDGSDGFDVPPVNTALFNGGSGRGDASLGYLAPIVTSAFLGGIGRGDVSNGYSTPPVSAGLFLGGIGRGDVSDGYALPVPIASIFTGGIGRGDVSNTFMAPPLTANIFTGGNGRGDVSFSYSNDALVSNIYFGGNGRGDVSNAFLQAPLLSSIFSGGNGRGDVMNAYLLPLRVRLALKGFLEGPYDPTAGRMRDDLRTAGLIPTSEPYTALGYDFVQGGGEATTALVLGNDPQPKDRIVDWVVVELRDAMDPSIVVNSRSALIQRDGDVVDLDGFSALEITADPAPYHVALRHRNHLGAMTGSSYSLTGTALPIDLTSTGTLLSGTEPARVIAGAHALWAGDVTFDGTIKYTGEDNDRDLILQAIGGVVPTNFLDAVYRTEDVNMDGKVLYTGEDNDRDIILQNIGGVAPTNVREGTLP